MQSNKIVLASLVVLLAGCAAGVSTQEANRASLHLRLANAKLRQGALELAIREYRAAMELNPTDPEIRFGLSEAYRRKGLLDEAEATLLDTLRLDPEHHDARLNLSVVYLMQERWDKAIREATVLMDDATFLRPTRALVNRGWAHYNSGDLEAAERDLREVLVSDGGNVQAHLNLGRLRIDQGEVLDAMVHFERVLELIKRRPPAIFGAAEVQARFHLAQAHVTLGQREKAIEQLRAAAKRGGQGQWAQKSREYLAVLQ